MDERREHHDLIPFSEAGRRLLENADYQLLVKELEKDLAKLWRSLRETPTTDPRIAKIQGQLDQLEDMLGRAKMWIDRTANFARLVTPKPIPTDDYLTG